MKSVELSGQASRKILFYSSYSTAKTPDPFKLRKKCLICPMLKNWLTHETPVVDLEHVMMVRSVRKQIRQLGGLRVACL